MSEIVLRCPGCKELLTGEIPGNHLVSQLDEWARENLRCKCGVPQINGCTPLDGTLISVDGIDAKVWYGLHLRGPQFLQAITLLLLALLIILRWIFG